MDKCGRNKMLPIAQLVSRHKGIPQIAIVTKNN
jgi:hypothetical protein